MRKCVKYAALACLVVSAARSPAADSIRTHSREQPIRGEITEISQQQVKIDKGGIEDTIPVNDIISITFDREPIELTKGRNLAVNGQYADALTVLKSVDRNEITGTNKNVVSQDLDFYLAYCTTQMALGGAGTIKAAGAQLQAFYKNDSSKKSHHYLHAAELMGDLLVAFGMEAQHSSDKTQQGAAPTYFNNAMVYYGEAGKAPWAGADVGLNLKRGQALLAQRKTDEAAKAFQSVIDGATGPQAESLKLAALLGKAKALAAGNRTDEGIKLIEGVIAKAPKSNAELHGQAYLALGACHRAANKPQEAVLDYLRVDLLYFQNPQVHAEALASLAQLWSGLNRPDRSRDASARLASLYPNSIWNK